MTSTPPATAELGVIHGRFQVLHNDHLRYLLAGMQRCRHLVVGITNPDPFLTRDNNADPKRSRPETNPLTYFERYLMVRAAFEEAGIASPRYSVVPFPISLPELYRYYVPLEALFFLSIYDDWGRQKLAWFTSLGLATCVLRQVPADQKGLSAHTVREQMIRNGPWEEMVPPAVATLMKQWHIPRRLRELAQPA